MTEQEIKDLFESEDKLVEDKYGIVWCKFPKDDDNRPCSKYCSYKGGRWNTCDNIIKNPTNGIRSFVYYCCRIMNVEKDYNVWLIPIDIPEKLLNIR